MSWKRPNIGSRVNREVHARFWERAEVKFLRATRHERRFCDVCRTSALPPILTVTADILNRQLRARKRQYAPQQSLCLFDHLVGAGEQRRRHGEAERLRGFQIDSKLELRRLLNRKIGRVRSPKDAIDI